jgi:hypothetical protein
MHRLSDFNSVTIAATSLSVSGLFNAVGTSSGHGAKLVSLTLE